MELIKSCCTTGHPVDGRRRMRPKAGVGGMTLVAGIGTGSGTAEEDTLTRSQRDALTSDQIIEMMKMGNVRFRSGTMKNQDFLAQKRASAVFSKPIYCFNCISGNLVPSWRRVGAHNPAKAFAMALSGLT